MKIAMVCTGNICRSPLIEELARMQADKAGLGGRLWFESFGTHDYHIGKGADRRTVATARRFGVDLDRHRARQISADDCLRADLLLAMDAGHEQWLRALAPARAHDRIRLFLPWLGMTPRDVPDPYYGDDDGFIAVHQLLDEASQRLIQRLPALLDDGHR
ncbi:MAG: low molecular weight phosphotyrosine protein phosphatase [Xanthomonadales bacterium]|nr:low molecular weight phosphotyrosine protein phosphatase [Xanthomonadales bacterium]